MTSPFKLFADLVTFGLLGLLAEYAGSDKWYAVRKGEGNGYGARLYDGCDGTNPKKR